MKIVCTGSYRSRTSRLSESRMRMSSLSRSKKDVIVETNCSAATLLLTTMRARVGVFLDSAAMRRRRRSVFPDAHGDWSVHEYTIFLASSMMLSTTRSW